MWEALGPFIQIVEFLGGITVRRDDRTRAALTALGKALTETRFYLRDRGKGIQPDQAREDEIARLWNAASVELRGLDSRLADTCQHKSEYWTDPDGWTGVEPVQKAIEIEALLEKYHELLDVPGASLRAG